MGYDWFVIILVLAIVLTVTASAFAIVAPLITALRSTRNVKTETSPKDQFERWIHGKRRSGKANKPRHLKRMRTTGDQDMPPVDHGRVISLEPWKSFFIAFTKKTRLSWSVPHVIDQARCSDVNRRTLWIQARGFSSTGPVRYPIPLDGEEDLDDHVVAHLQGFRASFEAQVGMDIMEDTAHQIEEGMNRPSKARVSEAAVQQPTYVSRDVASEDQIIGG